MIDSKMTIPDTMTLSDAADGLAEKHDNARRLQLLRQSCEEVLALLEPQTRTVNPSLLAVREAVRILRRAKHD
jgi:hypothetical protein